MKIEEHNWLSWAKIVADPADPTDNSPAAVDKLMDILEPFIIRVKGVKTQFHAKNEIHLIDFQTEEGRTYYLEAVKRYQERVAKAMSDCKLSAKDINVIKLVAFLQYRIAAESNPDRIRYLTDRMYQEVTTKGKAACCAVNFKETIIMCVDRLVKHYGVKRDSISLIWGGGIKKESDKQKAKKSFTMDKDIMEKMKSFGIDLGDLGLDEVEDYVERSFDPSLRLGSQNLKERQNEIDKFQKGKSLYCFYTFRAGGVGLSLHHTDEFTKEKVRHKESGFAYEEDISKIPTRPRITLVAPTWSAIELVQGLGRAPRLTSLSDTEQLLIFFRGTVEERVAHIVSYKLRCLSKVVRQKESWESVIVGGVEEEQKYLTNNVTEDEEAEDESGGMLLEDDNNGKE